MEQSCTTTAEERYEIDSSAALKDVQEGNISQYEWNRLQSRAVEEYFNAREREVNAHFNK